MHMKCLVTLCSLAFLACDTRVTPPAGKTSAYKDVAGNKISDDQNWSAFGIQILPNEQSYGRTQADIRRRKMQLRDSFRGKTIDFDSVGTVFSEALINQIIPYWYGTPWSFEGHTAVPGQGRIACGYFISTTLQDAGLSLNRYRLAQQAPENEARAIAMGDSVMILNGGWAKDVRPLLQNILNDGLYFIGLGSSHVGYLLKRGERFFFLHANYTYPAEVRIEPANEKSVLSHYNTFFVVPVSGNKKLLEAWLNDRDAIHVD